ncbi:MAG: hypothetical protein ACLFUH_01220 [Bacteroidales bacterium]
MREKSDEDVIELVKENKNANNIIVEEREIKFHLKSGIHVMDFVKHSEWYVSYMSHCSEYTFVILRKK